MMSACSGSAIDKHLEQIWYFDEGMVFTIGSWTADFGLDRQNGHVANLAHVWIFIERRMICL